MGKLIKKRKNIRKNAQKRINSINLIGFNPNGAKSKWPSIKKCIRDLKSNVITIQETKCVKKGELKLEGFHVFEHTRDQSEGGGVAICINDYLNPVFICDGGSKAEAITVEFKVNKMSLNLTSAYGPQESSLLQKRCIFGSI